MNGKTAKLLRRWSTELSALPSAAKVLWKNTSRNKRFALRQNILEQLRPTKKVETVKTPEGKTLAVSEGTGMSSKIATMSNV